MALNDTVVRVAAVGDLHCGKGCQGRLQPLFARMAEAADVIVLCGDLTDYGLPEEAHMLAREMGAAKVPMLGVFGNHDLESGHADEVAKILTDGGVRLLDGDAVEIKGVGFAGVKGFAGGFGDRALQSWGEPVLKRFVREAVEEALKLETALARLKTPRRVAVLHYAPIRATVESEPPEIFPFLGSSRLEEPINRYSAAVAVHGHSHGGVAEGRTSAGIAVYNVSVPVLVRTFPERPPFRLIEIAVPQETETPAPATAAV